MVGKLNRGRARAAFSTIDHNEVGCLARGHHGFDDGKPFGRMAHTQLDAHRFAARQLTQLGHEAQQFDGVGKGRVAGR